MESLDQCRRLEVREKARNVFFVMTLRVSDHKVLHNIDRIFIKFFFSISLGFSRFFRSYFHTNMVRPRVRGNLRMRKQNSKTKVPLDVVPERRTKRFPRDFGPWVAFVS